MITPNDIQEKEFSKSVRGYKEDEVNKFLDLITLEMDKLIQENSILRRNNDSLSEELEKYKGSEGSIFETLETAKALMTDISASAEKRAEIVLKNAELEGERIKRDAKESVARLHDEASTLSTRWGQFRVKYKNLLENEMERLEGLHSSFLIDSDMEGLMTIPDAATAESKPINDSKQTQVPIQGKDHISKTIITPRRKDGE